MQNLLTWQTDEVADDVVNAHEAYEVGEKAVASMSGKAVFGYKYEKKHEIIPTKIKSMVTIGDEKVHVDTTLLFQSLIAVYSQEELSSAFMYELSSQPMSLFDKYGLMNAADKPKLKQAIKDIVGLKECNYKIPNDLEYVLDGGSLLPKVAWSVGQSFQFIYKSYVSYIRTRYGQHITVVFDGGYMTPSTKDTTHIRRTKGRIGKTDELYPGNPLTMKKSDFLLSNGNKQAFLFLLREVPTQNGINV